MTDDLWHVETHTLAPYKSARHVAVTTEQAIELVSHALAQSNIGGVVVYRPPLQTGTSYEER